MQAGSAMGANLHHFLPPLLVPLFGSKGYSKLYEFLRFEGTGALLQDRSALQQFPEASPLRFQHRGVVVDTQDDGQA